MTGADEMTETGWPLIPREVLPAPVPAAKRRPLPRPHHPDPGRQLPFFGAETTEPSPADLAGLLAGPGRLGRMGGTARVTVEVDAAWRVHVLVAELVIRGLTVQWRPLHDQDQEQPVRPEPVENEPTGDPFDDVYPDPDEWPDSSAADEPSDGDLVEDGRRDRQDPGAGRHLPVPGELSLTAGRRPLGPDAPDRPTLPVEPDTERAVPDEADTERALNKETEADKTEEEGAEPERRPRFEVLTAYSSRLNALARAWPEATAQLFLSGPRLRLWVAAAGEPVDGGYALGLDPAPPSVGPGLGSGPAPPSVGPGLGSGPAKDLVAIDAALVRVGLAGRVSDDGRHYLIVGKRRLRRLAELVGERPGAAPEEGWPGGAGA